MTASDAVPDHATLMALRRQGQSLAQIAETHGVSASQVWQALTAVPPVEDVPGLTVAQATGWEIEPRHRFTPTMRRLVTWARLQDGRQVSEERRQDLDEWLLEMDAVGAVLDYHPDQGPNDASHAGGFFYRGRTAEDEAFFRRHCAGS